MYVWNLGKRVMHATNALRWYTWHADAFSMMRRELNLTPKRCRFPPVAEIGDSPPSFSFSCSFLHMQQQQRITRPIAENRESARGIWHSLHLGCSSRRSLSHSCLAFFHVFLLWTSLCGREEREKEKDLFANAYYEEEKENLLPSPTLRILYRISFPINLTYFQ